MDFYYPDSYVGRVFEAIQYDDSCNLDELIISLKSIGVTCAISPLHDKDRYEADDPKLGHKRGELKKPHRHVLFLFEGKKSYRQIKEICSQLHLVKPVPMESRVRRLRYLCHLDDLDKEFYDPSEVICLGPLNYENECQKCADPDRYVREMQAFIRENNILSYAAFSDYCASNNPDWYNCLNKYRTMVIKEYMKSLAYEPKLKQIELEYQISQLCGSIATLEERKKNLEDSISRLTSSGCAADPVPLKGVVPKKNKP